MPSPSSLIMGIDVGTTSIKVALVDTATGEIVDMRSRDPSATVACHEASWSVQDVPRLLSTLHLLVSGLTRDLLSSVRHIVVCGQMHGVVLWRSGGEGWTRTQYGRMDARKCGQLVTWQDRRCDREFLAGLPEPQRGSKISSGYGCATLLWLVRYDARSLDQYNCAGTIVDFIVAMLANLDFPVMSVQNATSWGYFDIQAHKWDTSRLSMAGFPLDLLPKIVPPGEEVGQLQDCWEQIPAGARIYVGLGDLQCSIYPCLKLEATAALNLSTSAQMAFRISPDDLDTHPQLPSSIDMVPFFGLNDYVAVAASLNGGNVLARFVKMLQVWAFDLGLSAPQENQLFTRLTELGTNAPETDLHVVATLFGERHCPEQRGRVENLRTQNLQLGSVYKALCRGVVRNLAEMMPPKLLKEWGRVKIVGSGSALSRNSVLQSCFRTEFPGFEFEIVAGKGACAGAAFFIRDQIHSSSSSSSNISLGS